MTGAPIAGPGDDVAAEYEALRRGVGAYRAARAVVTVTGPDATTYLQGQLSQDVSPLGVGASAWALLLEPDGKLSALLRVTRTAGDAYALDTDVGFAETVEQRLSRFRLRTKVTIEAGEWPCVALRGAGVRDAVGNRSNTANANAASGGSVGPSGPSDAGAASGPPWMLPVEWNGTRGVDLLGPGAEDRVPAGARQCGRDAWEALRIEAGIPQMGAELDARTIAAEAGLVERAVSFTKGCYTGQELVARLDARGNRVARRLCGIVAPGLGAGEARQLLGVPMLAPGAEKPVGTCTSAAWSPALGATVALAYVHRSVAVPATLRAQFGTGARAGSDAPVGSDAATAVEVRALPLVEC